MADDPTPIYQLNQAPAGSPCTVVRDLLSRLGKIADTLGDRSAQDRLIDEIGGDALPRQTQRRRSACRLQQRALGGRHGAIPRHARMRRGGGGRHRLRSGGVGRTRRSHGNRLRLRLGVHGRVRRGRRRGVGQLRGEGDRLRVVRRGRRHRRGGRLPRRSGGARLQPGGCGLGASGVHRSRRWRWSRGRSRSRSRSRPRGERARARRELEARQVEPRSGERASRLLARRRRLRLVLVWIRHGPLLPVTHASLPDAFLPHRSIGNRPRSVPPDHATCRRADA